MKQQASLRCSGVDAAIGQNLFFSKMNMLKQLFSRLLQVPSSTKEEMAKITITITGMLAGVLLF